MHKKDDHNVNQSDEPGVKSSETQNLKPNTSTKVSELEQLQSELSTARQAQAEAIAQNQRALADYSNLKKRFDKERQELAKFAAESIVVQLLSGIDNLERAVNYANPDEQQSSLYQGVKMTLQHIDDTLKTIGFNRLDVKVSQPFNPEIHEAIELVKGAKNQIIEVVESGYSLHDKILRPARVRVGDGEEIAK